MNNIDASDTPDNPFRDLWALGYRNLIPIIPPNAPLYPHGKMHERLQAGEDARGKVPGVKRGDTWSGIDLNSMIAEESDLDAWHAMGASVGIKTGNDGLIAVDVDTTHPDTARLIYEMAAQHLGSAPARFGRKPKVLLPYVLHDDEETPTYRAVRFSTPDEESAHVELLSAGRQFVAKGTHPKTNRPYTWPQGIAPFGELTRITRDDLDAFFLAVREALPHAQDVAGRDRHVVNQDTLTADANLLRDAIDHLPNSDEHFPTRHDFIRVGCAIKAAFGPDNEDEALDAYLDWAKRWDGGYNDPRLTRQNFGRMKPPFEIGAQWIFDHAERLGNWQGAHRRFLEAIPGADRPTSTAQHHSADTDDANRPRFEVLKRTAIDNLPKPRFLIDRYVPEKSLGFLFGAPGSAKSFLAIDMAMHLAYGAQTWHGDDLAAKEGGWVIYLAREGSSGLRARLRAWETQNAETVESARAAGRECRFALIRDSINFMQKDDIAAVAQAVAAAGVKPIDMIVVDTVARVLPGADENAAEHMGVFVEACAALQDVFDCTVLGVHHAGKSGDMRGSSALRGAGDFVLKMEKGNKTEDGGFYARVTCEKQKDAEDGWQDHYRLLSVDVSDTRGSQGSQGSPEGGETSLSPLRCDAPTPVQSDRVSDHVVSLILTRLQTAWDSGLPLAMTHQARERYAVRVLASEMGLRAEAVETTLLLLERTGHISTEICDRKRKISGLKVLKFGLPQDEESGDPFA